jgi:hypothetical protein
LIALGPLAYWAIVGSISRQPEVEQS